MGIVWRAVDERLERSVAVKQIITQPGLSEAERANVRQRAMREAKNAARFQHPNAIVVFDIAEHAGDPCLVMEYLPSRSLSAILAEHGTLPVPEVARIGEQVAAALVAAHRAGIVHRDIKPGNILIDDNGTCKITDFGISRASGDLTLTQTGLIGGTPAYLAPELARGADPTPASDVFSLGATLYHAIEGVPPYGDNTNQLALLYSAANGKVNPPTRSGAATALLMSLLRTEPDERPTMSEARERLASLARSEANGKPLGATLVSPPMLHSGSGPRPAAPSMAPVAPPWRREPSPSEPPRHPTTAGTPLPPPGNGGDSPRNRRKPLVFGAIGAAVAVIAAVLAIALSSGDDGSGASADGSATSSPNTPSPSSTSAPSSPSQPATSDGVVSDWGAAGARIEAFYGNPQGSWSMLTPNARAAYGNDPAKFAQYWQNHTVVGYRDIQAYKGANNPDGSVDMRLFIDIGNGPQQLTLRVVQSGGTLLIDGDTRPDGGTSG
ncbi:protein kinase [Prauserella oleivorans]|uniref:non-specific serine/threonine protein kinase n=1 Tax=Prauserella oleivorans TaxID=1478153 RepID=A0ABW5W6M5_9PSEU